jgi:hypothetical protein
MGDVGARVLEQVTQTICCVGGEPIRIPRLTLQRCVEAPKHSAPRDPIETAVGEAPLHDVGWTISEDDSTVAPKGSESE